MTKILNSVQVSGNQYQEKHDLLRNKRLTLKGAERILRKEGKILKNQSAIMIDSIVWA